MKNKKGIKWYCNIGTLLAFLLVIGLFGLIFFNNNNNEEVYCIWKIKTNSDSIHQDAVVWEDGNYDKEYIKNILIDGNIWSLETICFLKNKLNPDGTRIQVFNYIAG